MAKIKYYLNGLVLALANIFSISASYTIIQLFPSDLLLIQVPIATFLSVLTFFLWHLIIKKTYSKLSIDTTKDQINSILISLLLMPFINIPLFYLSEKNLPNLAYLLVIWLFQIPTNSISTIICVYLNRYILLFNVFKKK